MRKAFSLVEVAMSTAMVGLGVVSLMTFVGSGTRINGQAQDLTRASFLVQEMREWTLRLPFSDPDPGDAGKPPGPDGTDPQIFVDDLDDLLNVTYSPPRNGMGTAIADMPEWSETIVLTWRDPSNLSAVVSNGASDVIHVSLIISRQGREVLRTGWLVVRRDSP